MRVPKLDVAGSNPVSRSIFSVAYEYFAPCSKSANGVSLVAGHSQTAEYVGLGRVMSSHMGWMIVVNGVHENKLWRRSLHIAEECPTLFQEPARMVQGLRTYKKRNPGAPGFHMHAVNAVGVLGADRRLLPFGAIQFYDGLGTRLEHAIPDAIFFVLASAD